MALTVKELITELLEYPGDLPVCFYIGEDEVPFDKVDWYCSFVSIDLGKEWRDEGWL